MVDNASYRFALEGPVVPILPALDDRDRIDVDAVAGWVDSLIDRGVRLFWTTYGTTHFMAMTDDEVRALTRGVAAVTRGRAGFIASTAYHWPLADMQAFIEQCAEWGADAVKVQNDWRVWPPAHDRFVAFYQELNDRTPLPLLAYTFGSPGVTPDLLKRVLELPRFIGMKNDSGDFYEQTWYLRTVRESGRPFEVMTGGTMESALHAWHFGARCYAVGLAVFAPAPALRFHELLRAGEFAAAAAIVRDVEQPVFGTMQRMGPQSHWASLHAALYLQGFFKTPAMRFPLRTFEKEQVEDIRTLLTSHRLLEV